MGQPVVLEVGDEPATLIRNRDVSLRVPEADGGGDVEGLLHSASRISRIARFTTTGRRASTEWSPPGTGTSRPPVAVARALASANGVTSSLVPQITITGQRTRRASAS